MPTSRKPIVSYRPYWGDLLILMPRIRILHFPGPELAGLSKKSKRKLNFWTKIKKFSCCDLTIFFLHFLKKFSVHVLLYKSSLDYNNLLKLFESFKKSNFKTLKKFQISIVIQIGSIKQNVDKKNSKKFWDKKKCQNEVVNFQNYFEKSQHSLAIFEQSSHFWTWKMQNLESRHQN